MTQRIQSHALQVSDAEIREDVAGDSVLLEGFDVWSHPYHPKPFSHFVFCPIVWISLLHGTERRIHLGVGLLLLASLLLKEMIVFHAHALKFFSNEIIRE